MPAVGFGELFATNEADLVARVAAGDTGAPAAELYRRYGRRIYRFGLQALGDPALAKAMVQECFVRLWQTAPQLDGGGGSAGRYLLFIPVTWWLPALAAYPRSRPFGSKMLRRRGGPATLIG